LTHAKLIPNQSKIGDEKGKKIGFLWDLNNNAKKKLKLVKDLNYRTNLRFSATMGEAINLSISTNIGDGGKELSSRRWETTTKDSGVRWETVLMTREKC
jgi:hypothetical protein